MKRGKDLQVGVQAHMPYACMRKSWHMHICVCVCESPHSSCLFADIQKLLYVYEVPFVYYENTNGINFLYL